MRRQNYKRVLTGCMALWISLAMSVSAFASTGSVSATGPAGAVKTQSYSAFGPGAQAMADATPITGTEEPIFGGGHLTLLASQGGAQMLSVIMQSASGGLIVVDGGWEADADHLIQAIKDRGGRVNAWLITHPDGDHVGALYNILQREASGITIDHIYISLAPMEWYLNESPEDYGFISALTAVLAQRPAGEVIIGINRGTQIQAPGINISVVNHVKYGSYGSRSVNNSSVLYRVEMNGVRTLFLGDLSDPVDTELLQEVPADELKADIVQMAHHGQSGVGREVYAAVSPSICLWSTPQWLWNNDGGNGYNTGSWKTLEVRGWMESLGVQKNYSNKDGDITIR